MKHLQPLAFATVAGLLLAGCTDTPTDPSAVPATGTDSSTATGGEATILGQVVNEELQPIAGVEVALARSSRPSVQTDEAGRFRFSGLDAGFYAIVAQRLGYETATKSVTVAAGEEAVVQMTLSEITVATPYARTVSGDGYVDVAVGVYNQQLWPILVNVTSFRRNWFYFKLNEGPQSIATLLRWQPSSAAHTKYLEHALYAWPNGSGASTLLNYTKGTGPLRLRGDDLGEYFTGKKDQFYMGFRLMPCDANCPPDAMVQTAIEQRMSLYATVFYHQPAPAGFALTIP